MPDLQELGRLVGRMQDIATLGGRKHWGEFEPPSLAMFSGHDVYLN